MKIFLSHRSRDKATVRDVKERLPRFLHTWIDEDRLIWGDSVAEQLKTAITAEADFVIIFLSVDSLDSEWIQRELGWTLERERSLNRTFLLPVILDGDRYTQLPPEISNRLYLRLQDYGQSSVEQLAAQISEKLFQLFARDHLRFGNDKSMGQSASSGSRVVDQNHDLYSHLAQTAKYSWSSPHLHQYSVITILRDHPDYKELLIDDTTITFEIRTRHLGMEKFMFKHRYTCELAIPNDGKRTPENMVMSYDAHFGSESFSIADLSSSVIQSGGQKVVRFELTREIPVTDKTSVRIRQRSVVPSDDCSIYVLTRYPIKGFEFKLSYRSDVQYEFTWFKAIDPDAVDLPGNDEYHMVADGIVAKSYGWLLPGEGIALQWERGV